PPGRTSLGTFRCRAPPPIPPRDSSRAVYRRDLRGLTPRGSGGDGDAGRNELHHVFPGWSGISSPERSSKTVTSETLGRFHAPSMQCPFRQTYALPLPVGITSGETTPFTSLTGPCFVSTTWMTTFFAETWSPFSRVCGTVPWERSHFPPCHFQ